MSDSQADLIYGAAQAAADLAEAGLLSGIVSFDSAGRQNLSPDAELKNLQGGFTGAGLDSRKLAGGELFVAMIGAHVDGRQFMPEVLADGHWVLAQDTDLNQRALSSGQTDLPPGAGILLTADPTGALACLAGNWRARLDLWVTGITGTNGKTTTKDFLAAMFRAAGPTWSTAGNFNNRLGLPLTLLGLRPEHRYAAIEMGASAVGDIARLAPLATPRVGVITNASPAHLAEFGSLADIIQGKGEILDALPENGCAVLNADSPGFGTWKDRAPCPVESFGCENADHVWTWSPQGSHGLPVLKMDGEAWPVPLPGQHNGANLAAAVLAARACGLTEPQIREGLAGFVGSAHRGVLTKIAGRTVLDDCYNANPVSMLAAGRAVGRLPGSGPVVAVLGAMAELGDDSSAIHEDTGKRLAAGPVDLLIAVGKNARPLGVGFDAGGGVSHYCADLKEAALAAARHTRPGDRLLIKGSRSAAMEDILPLLVDAFASHGPSGKN